MNKCTTGAVIKELRESHQMTQAELAEKLCVSDKAVSKWETAKGYPDISLLEPIAKVFNISVAELISGIAVTNVNIAANMMHTEFYICPICGNVIHSIGEAVIHCHGVLLSPLTVEEPDENHNIFIEKVEDEYYVRIEHDMTKTHYISFVVAVSSDKIQMKKLYPEGNAEARFKIRGVKKILFYCNRDGLFSAIGGALKGENVMRAFDNSEFEKYKAEVKEKWGKTDAYKEHTEKTKHYSKEKWNSLAQGMDDIMAKFAVCMKSGEEPGSTEAQNLVKMLQNHITENYYLCTDEILAGLGQMYVADERFKNNIDKHGDGTAEFICEAVKVYCGKTK